MCSLKNTRSCKGSGYFMTISYYEGGVSSCYFWDKEDGGFASAWLVRKNVDKARGVDQGSWSSINVIDVRSDASKRKWTYKITSSVVLEMNINQPDTGNFNVAGSLTKSVRLGGMEGHPLTEGGDVLTGVEH